MERKPGVTYSADQIRHTAIDHFMQIIVVREFIKQGVELEHIPDIAVARRILTDPSSRISVSIGDLSKAYKAAEDIGDFRVIVEHARSMANGISAQDRYSIAMRKTLELRRRLSEHRRG